MSTVTSQRPGVSGRREAGSPAGPPGFPAGPVVKLCGLTRERDVLAACAAGVWGLGFIFAPSPRCLTPVDARDLLERSRVTLACGAADQGPLTVGVFVDSTAEDIAAVTRYVGLDAVQLHGPRAPSAAAVRKALTGWEAPRRLGCAAPLAQGGERPPIDLLIIRAIGVAVDENDPAALRIRLEEGLQDDALLLVDASVPGRAGGTGQRVPWDIVAEAAAGLPFLLAGGIRPGNVREALLSSGAWGVDVSSGVESAPGIKEGEALKGLMTVVEAVRRSGSDGDGVQEEEGQAR